MDGEARLIRTLCATVGALDFVLDPLSIPGKVFKSILRPGS